MVGMLVSSRACPALVVPFHPLSFSLRSVAPCHLYRDMKWDRMLCAAVSRRNRVHAALALTSSLPSLSGPPFPFLPFPLLPSPTLSVPEPTCPFPPCSLPFCSLQHPIAATILGLLYIVARLLYFVGYSGSGPSGRQIGK